MAKTANKTAAVAVATPTPVDARMPMAHLKTLGFSSSWTLANFRWLKRGSIWYPDANGGPLTDVSIAPTSPSKRVWILTNHGIVIGQSSKMDHLAPLYNGAPPTDEQIAAHNAAIAQREKLAADLAAADAPATESATATATESGDDTKPATKPARKRSPKKSAE